MSHARLLAFVGSAVAEELVARLLHEAAQFSTAATLPQGKNTTAATFAVGRSVQSCETPYQRPLHQDDPNPDEIPSCVSEKNLRARWEACCSHIAYAHTCVMLKLHQGTQHNSPELAQSMKCFEKMLRRRGEKNQQIPGLVFLPTMHHAPLGMPS